MDRLNIVPGIFILACLTCGGVPSVSHAQADPYDTLYDVIMKRRWPNGQAVDQDSPTPLLWAESRYLLQEPTRSRFVAALDDLEALNGDKLRASGPLKRAMLQSQLWTVFDWTASLRPSSTEPVVLDIQSRLARLLKRLTLSDKDIQSLPETITQSVAKATEASTEGESKLPADLYDESGPWVCLRRVHSGLIAPAHSESAEWRSVFLVFMRVPGGRRAALDYLGKLGSFRDTLVSGERGPELNPDTPQFPVGTQFALVERPLLISDRGEPVMSPVCFRIQLRSYLSVTQTFIPEYSTEPTQRLAEFVLRPRRLMDGIGSLKPLHVNQTHYATFFTKDPFERPGRSTDSNEHLALRNCMVCHAAPGILSVNSRAFTQLSRELPASFREGSPESIALPTIAAKRQHHTWGLLQGLWRQAGKETP